MNSGVAYVFKTLIKIPFIIFASFLFFNIFAFTVSYFRVIGAANTIQQIVMDNNFLTDSDKDTVQRYLESLETTYLQNVTLILNTDGEEYRAENIDHFTFPYTTTSGETRNRNGQGKNDRKQYGHQATVGVTADYRFIMPLLYTETIEDGRVAGYGSQVNGPAQSEVALTATQQEDLRTERASRAGNITVVSTVVGMQYYSDLDVVE